MKTDNIHISKTKEGFAAFCNHPGCTWHGTAKPARSQASQSGKIHFARKHDEGAALWAENQRNAQAVVRRGRPRKETPQVTSQLATAKTDDCKCPKCGFPVTEFNRVMQLPPETLLKAVALLNQQEHGATV